MARKSCRYGTAHSQLATPGGIQAVWGQQGTSGPSAHRGGRAQHPVDTGCGEPHVGKASWKHFFLYFLLLKYRKFSLKNNKEKEET